MKKNFTTFLKWLPALLIFMISFYLSSQPTIPQIPSFPFADKIVHFICFDRKIQKRNYLTNNHSFSLRHTRRNPPKFYSRKKFYSFRLDCRHFRWTFRKLCFFPSFKNPTKFKKQKAFTRTIKWKSCFTVPTQIN